MRQGLHCGTKRQGFSALRCVASTDCKALLPMALGVTFLLCTTRDILTWLQQAFKQKPATLRQRAFYLFGQLGKVETRVPKSLVLFT